MKLNSISLNKKKKKRVGRGIGSGLGKTSGKGHKGQKSRSGGFHKIGFEGGQTTIQKRLPKIGFKSFYKKKKKNLNLNFFNKKNINSKNFLNLFFFKKKKIIPHYIKYIKILNNGFLNKKIYINNIYISKNVKKKIKLFKGKYFFKNKYFF